MKHLLLLGLFLPFLAHGFNLPFNVSSEQLAEVRAQIDKTREEMSWADKKNTTLLAFCSALSKVALVASLKSLCDKNYTCAFVCAGASGLLEGFANLALLKCAKHVSDESVIMIAENILVTFQNALPNDKNQQ